MATAIAPSTASIAPANARGAFGLYPADHFRLTDGRYSDCPTHRAALWYFEGETIAVPLPDRTTAGFATATPPFDDVRAWLARRAPDAPIDYPPLVWVESPLAVRNATLGPDGSTFAADGTTMALRLVDRIALNRSYFDASSARFFGGRACALRGAPAEGAFVARTLWPEDFRLRARPPDRAVPDGDTPQLTLRAWMRELPHGGAQGSFTAWTAWRARRAPADMAGRTVLAFMVNGAQGDDDEAHGGHFAIVTGRVAADGSIGDWLVNNFYTLDAESEKGIIAAPLPLDNYLGDLNSGQA
ncbi:MAG: hypothetical protein ABIR52_00985, partial [Casimicrobiaceae bacterium]